MDELYTSLDRSTVLARMYDAPSCGDFAVSFFLHGFDPTKCLETPWGSVELPVPQEFRPSHLANRRYVYPD